MELFSDLNVENNVHSVDVVNWFLGGRPKNAIDAGGATVAKRGEKHATETSETHLRHFAEPGKHMTGKSSRNNTIDSASEFVSRVAEGRPGNTPVQGAEGALTVIVALPLCYRYDSQAALCVRLYSANHRHSGYSASTTKIHTR